MEEIDQQIVKLPHQIRTTLTENIIDKFRKKRDPAQCKNPFYSIKYDKSEILPFITRYDPRIDHIIKKELHLMSLELQKEVLEGTEISGIRVVCATKKNKPMLRSLCKKPKEK